MKPCLPCGIRPQTYPSTRARLPALGLLVAIFWVNLLPASATKTVNRYHILGQIPRLFNSVLASQPKVNGPFDIYGLEP